MITVSVLMPAYNAEKTISQSVASVVRQTYPYWQLYILDDGSTDNTSEVVRSIRDKRIRYVKLAHRGLCDTLNEGLGMVETEWIARLDADDLWHSERLSRQIEYLLEHPRARVIGSWGERINDKGKHLTAMNVGPSSEFEYNEWRAKGRIFYLIHSSVLAHRETVIAHGGYREAEYPCEDVFLWTRIARRNQVIAIPRNLTSYRISSRGISNQNFFRQAMQTERLRTVLKTGRELTLEEYKRERLSSTSERLGFLRRTYARYWFRQGGSQFVNGRAVRGLVFLAGSICLDPGRFVRRVLSRT